MEKLFHPTSKRSGRPTSYELYANGHPSIFREKIMKRLWAPWRMKYILESKKPAGCILCEEAKKNDDRRNYILYRGRHSFVIMNLYPYNNGHLLIVPFTHESELDRLPEAELADLMKTTQSSVNILKQAMQPEGFNIGINIGKSAARGSPNTSMFRLSRAGPATPATSRFSTRPG